MLSIEPLERGYGMTLGNSLRRVLLSSIRGAAITSIRIEGVLHEFSTVPGVREDVIEMMMNLKHVPVLAQTNEVKTLRLEVDGPCEVKAKHIQPDVEIEFVDPEAPICSLEEGGHLSMDLYIEQGTGYLSSERPRPAWLPLDALLVDAIFSPVLRVNYEVEAARVGQHTDFERLVLYVWTNGIIIPEMAVREAAMILRTYFDYIAEDLALLNPEAATKTMLPGIKVQPAPGPTGQDFLSRSVRELDLSIRSENCLLRAGIATVADILKLSREDLLKIRNLGKVSLVEIEEKLSGAGYSLRPKDADPDL